MLHPMRRLMSVAEARKPELTHEQRVQQEQQRQAKVLLTVKAEVATLKTKVLTVAKAGQTSEFDLRGAWDQQWVTEVRKIINTLRAQATASAKEEFEFEQENNPNAVMPPVYLLDLLQDGFARWWDQKKDSVDWGDAHYRLDDYMDAHPRTEMSDDMSRLRSEDEMLRHIQYRGGFGSLGEMDKTLDEFSSYLSDINHIMDGGWSGIGATTIDLFKKGIPVTLLFAQLITAIP